MEAERWPVLTIRQPWCWAIVHGGKPVENRSWNTAYRGPLWLHAGARSRWDPAGAEFRPLRNAWGRYLLDLPGYPRFPATDIKFGRATTLMPFGAVAALAEVTGCHHATGCPASGPDAPWPLCTAWSARGQFHIELANVRPLPDPVPCRGALGLWRLPDDVEKAVRAQLEPEPCQCHKSFAYISPTHPGHCCFVPASQACHPAEVAEWERQRDLRRPSAQAQLGEAGDDR